MGVKLKAKYKKAQQAISGTINRMRASISGENYFVLHRVSIHSKGLKMALKNIEKATLTDTYFIQRNFQGAKA